MDRFPAKAADSGRLVERMAALAQPSRLAAVRLLARYQPFGLPAGDIARLLAVPHNTLSTHLALIEKAGLVRSRRDGRHVIFAVDPDGCAALSDELGAALRPTAGRDGRVRPLPVVRPAAEAARPYRVLVLCSANSARSLMAEALINREGRGRFEAVSAGARPAAAPHPEAFRLLTALGYAVAPLRAKDWSCFGGDTTTPFDFVITVCDAARGEPCPAWPGHPLGAHWGIADPAEAPPHARRAAMLDAYRQLSARVTSFVNLPVETLDLASLRAALVGIGRLEGATPLALREAA
jgi:arsenate reductase